MESLAIRHIVEQVDRGQIRVPAFQRGFVWEPERVAHLMDSIYKGYPFGALLFWRTNEKLMSERNLGPFELAQPQDDYPIDYVLDGQQRVTSIYATFRSSPPSTESAEWREIYFDYSIPDDIQEPQFFALDSDSVQTDRHFPLRALFDTVQYRTETSRLDAAVAARIDSMQSKFKEAVIPVQIFRTDEKSAVAVIFERINRQGVPLDTLQLLSAWTWSEDFQLQQQFEDLIDEIESKGFETGSFDENLLLRCASSILVDNPRPDAIVTVPGDTVRRRFDEVTNGILGALDFLEMNLSVRRMDNLPFQTILVPLSIFFATSGDEQVVVTSNQRDQLLQWFWRTCFSRRYSSGVLRNIEEDIRHIRALKAKSGSSLGVFPVRITSDFFLANRFGVRNVNTKTFVLLLGSNSPRSLISGTPINVNDKLKEYNKSEFHHIVPKSYVKSLGSTDYNVNCLANHCFLTRSENNELGGVAPSQYRSKLAKNEEEVLESVFCDSTLFDDGFDTFVANRAERLHTAALERMRISIADGSA